MLIAQRQMYLQKTTFGCIAKADGHFHVVTNGKAVNEVYCEYNGVTADKISDLEGRRILENDICLAIFAISAYGIKN